MKGKAGTLGHRLLAGYHVGTGMMANVFGKTPLPRIAHYCPTWRCNQQCQSCTVWEREPEGELSTEEAVAMFSQLPFLDVVKMVGGEPFCRADLGDIAEGIIRYCDPYILQVVTNGSMPDKVTEFARRVGSPRLHIRVSLSGIEKTHEQLSQGASYDRVIQTIEKLATLRSSIGFSLGINYRVSDETVDDLPRAVDLFRKMGVDLVVGVHYSPFLQDTDVENTEFKTISKDPGKLMAAMDKIPTERANMSAFERLLLGVFSRASAQRGLLGNPKKARFGCRELRNLLYLMPNGDLVPCGLRQKPVANLAKQDLRTVWNSSEMDAQRLMVDNCPGCPQAAIEIFSRLYLGPFRKWFL